MRERKPVIVDPEEMAWIRGARKLTEGELAERRERLARSPEDVRLRVEVLIGLCRSSRQEVDLALLAEQLEWMLGKRLRSDATRVACGMLAIVEDPSLRDRVGEIVWRAADAARTPMELELLSTFFFICEPARSKELLLRARALDAGNEAHWDERLRQQDAVDGTSERDGVRFRRMLGLAVRADAQTVTSEGAAKLEARLLEAPDDHAARLLLISAYNLQSLGLFKEQPESGAEMRRKLQAHVSWLVEHAPGAHETGATAHHIYSRIDGAAFHELVELWTRQIAAHGDDAPILGNAAEFFTHDDKRRALSLLKRARELEPGKPEWSERIASLLSLELRRAGPEERRALTARIHAELERAHAADPGPQTLRDISMARLARAALAAGDLARAEELARQIIDTVRFDTRWRGDGTYEGHLILGQVALERGDVEDAKGHLLAATDVGERRVFIPSGPRVELARKLLEVGEREAVLAYLERCALMFEQDLTGWCEVIRTGGMPELTDSGS